MRRKQPTPIRDLLTPLVSRALDRRQTPVAEPYRMEPYDYATAILNDPRAIPQDHIPIPPHLRLPTDDDPSDP